MSFQISKSFIAMLSDEQNLLIKGSMALQITLFVTAIMVGALERGPCCIQEEHGH